MEIKVLGTGCAKCKKLLEVTQEAVQELGRNDEVIYVTDINEILRSGVLGTPALVLNKQPKVSGRVPSKDEIKQLISAAE